MIERLRAYNSVRSDLPNSLEEEIEQYENQIHEGHGFCRCYWSVSSVDEA